MKLKRNMSYLPAPKLAGLFLALAGFRDLQLRPFERGLVDAALTQLANRIRQPFPERGTETVTYQARHDCLLLLPEYLPPSFSKLSQGKVESFNNCFDSLRISCLASQNCHR